MVNTSSLSNFRDLIDADNGLQSIKKQLTIICVIFISINITGATIEEANTFIFKIKFLNYSGLGFLFIVAIIFLTLRYYSYATQYQVSLSYFWRNRLISDYTLYSIDPIDKNINGLLGKAVDVWGEDEPGIQSPEYCIDGIFRRSVAYGSTDLDDYGNQVEVTIKVPLNKFNDRWKRTDLSKLLLIEFKYRIEAILKYRENLDILSPYLLSISALASYIYKNYIFL